MQIDLNETTLEFAPTINADFNSITLEVNPTIEVSLEPTIEFNPQLSIEPSYELDLSLEPSVDVQIDLNETTLEFAPTINADFSTVSLEVNPTIEVRLEPTIEFNPQLSIEPSYELDLSLEPSVDVSVDLPELTATVDIEFNPTIELTPTIEVRLEPTIEFNPQLSIEPSYELDLSLEPSVDVQIDLPEFECDPSPVSGNAIIHGWAWDEIHSPVAWSGEGVVGLNAGIQIVSRQIQKITEALTRSAVLPYDSRNCSEVAGEECGGFESRSGLVSVEVLTECTDDKNLTPVTLRGKLTPVIFEMVADTTKRHQTIRNEVCCHPVAIMPSDIYQEFALESRLTLSFVRDTEWEKIGSCGKWTIEVPNPRLDLTWCKDFEQFGYKKGNWYVRLEWGNQTGLRTGCYTHSKKEAERVGEILNSLTLYPTARMRISRVNRKDREMVKDCVRVNRAVLSVIDPATNTLIKTTCFVPVPCDPPYQGCNYLDDCD